MISAESTSGARRFATGLLRVGLAVALVAGALALTSPLQNFVPRTGFVFFYAAVVASTWFGGKLPGVVAVIISTLAVEYFFIPPLHSLGVSRAELPVFVEFAASAVLVGWFSSWRRQAETALQQARDELQTRVEERTAELKQSNEQLLAEIAERKRAEDAYYEAQAELARVTRISALGALAASISHEVNQPLAAVVTNADACAIWLSSETPNLQEARAAVDAIAREGTRASDVIRRIRAMFTKSAPERTRIQINELIREVGGLMQAGASRNLVTIETDLAEDLPEAMVDRIQLQQVIVNLVQNAIEAMSSVTDRARLLLIRSKRQGPEELLVEVRDSGIGIKPKDEKRIFNPFFTTKDHGMGMGLSISHSVVEAHGGRLWATANDEHGATLQFTLPIDNNNSL